MTYSIVNYTGSGSVGPYNVTFPYITKSHVEVRVGGVLKTVTTDYTWPTTGTIQFVSAVTTGLAIEFRRNSSRAARVVTFQDAGVLTEERLNLDSNQLLYIAEEAFDAATNTLQLASALYDAGDHRIINVADPVDVQDAATKSYVDAVVTGGAPGTPLAITNGGTGQASAAAALNALGAAPVVYQQSGTGSVARTVNTKLADVYLSVKDFGAVGDGSTDDSTAVQAAINRAIALGGSTVYFPSGSYKCNTPLSITGSSVRLLGNSVGSTSIVSTANGGYVLTVTGTRHAIENLLIYRNVFSASTSDALVSYNNAVQCKMDNCWLQGGYYNLQVVGGACADNVFTRCIFTFATGVAMVVLARFPAGINGGHHFYRCLFNQGYAQGTPVAASFKGARGNATVYALGDVITVGSYLFGCTSAGTSAGSVPAGLSSPPFYGVPVADGTALWQLQGHAAYRGLHIDSGLSYVRVRECDLTGPFSSAIEVSDTLGVAAPYEVVIETCTAHGPMTTGLNVGYSAREITVKNFNTFNATAPGTTYGILMAGSEGAIVHACQTYGFTNGIYSSMTRSIISDNISVANVNGIRIAPNTNMFNITGNVAGSLTNRGANTVAIYVEAGTSDRYNITSNIINGYTTTGVADGGSGVNKTVSGNW